MFDQGVRGQALGWLVPLELVSVVAARGVAMVVAPVDVVLCLSGRRPWPVTARRLGRSKRRHTWWVTGWMPSTLKVHEVESALRSGRHLPEGEAVA
jgi:hypothetical protein